MNGPNAAASRPLPPMHEGDQTPFYYASLVDVEVLYLVDPATVEPYMKQEELELVVFDEGKAAVGFNFQMYTSHFPDSMGQTMEIELYALAAPRDQTPPRLSFREWALGMDQSHLVGYYRFDVPCNDPIAIEAGERKFGEPKFFTEFIPSLPSLNGEPTGAWSFACCDPSFLPKDGEQAAREHAIFSCEAKTEGLLPAPSYPAPITVYGAVTEPGPDKGKLIGARWSVFGPWQTYLLEGEEAERVRLTYGDSSHQMQQTMRALIGGAPAAAVRTYASPPCSVQPRTFWP